MPAAFSAMLNNAYRVIDQHAVQWLGVDSQAAIASCSFILIGFYAVYSIFSSGAIALVARAVGSGDQDRQSKVIGAALLSSILAGIALLTASFQWAPYTTASLGLKANVAAQAQIYMSWHALFCLPQAVMPTIDAIFIAYGKTKAVLVLQITASVLNFILNPVFIYFLNYGIGGAALATGLSQLIALVIGCLLLGKMRVLNFKHMRFNEVMAKIVRIGLPMCWGTMIFAAVYWALLRWVISPLGPEVNAALGIGFSVLEGFTWPVFWGFSMGIASIVGRCLGANDLAKAKHAINLAFKMMTVCGVLATLIFIYASEYLSAIFTGDSRVLQQATLYGQVLAYSQLFIAYEALAEGILSGSGYTQAIFYWSAPLNLLRVPLAWLFAIDYGYGAIAVWWVINLSTFFKTLGKWATVASGRWQ
jgi:putative MATE family efflux protein